jgi:hypothetical protein
MNKSSILSALTLRFAEHPENIATDALLYILQRSKAASDALVDLARGVAPGIQVPKHFRAQAVGGDGAIPDLVGIDDSGKESLIIEAKFWAGLTDAQPLTYLKRIEGRGGLLLFVCPAARIPTLWSELTLRCASSAVVSEQEKTDEIRTAKLTDGTVLGLVSWRTLLTRVLIATRDAREEQTPGDVVQLLGLCNDMDTEAFLPLRSEELTGPIGRRLLQFSSMVDDLTDQLIAEGHGSKEGLRASGVSGSYGKYMWIHGYGCQLVSTMWKWNEWGYSPIWLRVTNAKWAHEPAIFDYLRGFLRNAPLFQDNEGTWTPVRLKTAAEKESVLADAYVQLLAVANALAARPLTSPSVSFERRDNL